MSEMFLCVDPNWLTVKVMTWKGCSDRLDTTIDQLGLVSHHLGSLLGVNELTNMSAFQCGARYFDAQSKESLPSWGLTYSLLREEVYGRWNGLPASRETPSLIIIWRLQIVHDHIKRPPVLYLYLLSFIIYIYIYITTEWEVSTIIWRLPIVHDQIERPPVLYFCLLFLYNYCLYK